MNIQKISIVLITLFSIHAEALTSTFLCTDNKVDHILVVTTGSEMGFFADDKPASMILVNLEGKKIYESSVPLETNTYFSRCGDSTVISGSNENGDTFTYKSTSDNCGRPTYKKTEAAKVNGISCKSNITDINLSELFPNLSNQ